MPVSLQTAPGALAPRAVAGEENARVSHAVTDSRLYVRGCGAGHDTLPAPPASALQVPVFRLAVICRDELTGRRGPSLQKASRVVEKAEKERRVSPQWNYFQ